MRASEGEGVPRGRELDWRSVEWSRVRRAVYEVRQRYAYSYGAPIAAVRQRLLMLPREAHGDQRLVSQQLVIGGATLPVVSWVEDVFGNRVGRVRSSHVEAELSFAAGYRIARCADASEQAGAALTRGWDGGLYGEPTALTMPDAALRAVAADLARGGAGPLVLAERVHDWAAGAITYQIGVTGVQTPAATALRLGKGVCQDYAHLMLTVLRLVGVPARYVSGHLLGEGAPHAWVEALVADGGARGEPAVVAYDPTHHRRAGLTYITVAVGRDYADVAPTSGTFVGAAPGRLTATKHAEIVEIVYDDGAVWADGEPAERGAETAA